MKKQKQADRNAAPTFTINTLNAAKNQLLSQQ